METGVYTTGTDLLTADEHRMKDVRDHLDYLEDVWPDVVELRVPSNRARVGGRRHRSDHAIESARLLDMIEAAERFVPGAVVPPGRRPLPVDVTALDLIVAIVRAAEWTCSMVVQTAGADQLDPIGSVYQDPRPHLRRARAWLSGACEADPQLLDEIEALVEPVTAQTAAFLGDVLDGQLLDALCPWCRGRTETAPVGGQRTLRVVCPGARRRGTEEAEPPIIVCFGLECTPPERECGTRHGGRPAWNEREWAWLAPRLLTVG